MEPAAFQHCYDLLPEALLLVSADGKLVAANPAACTLCGNGLDALQSRCIQELTSDPEPKVSRFLVQCQRSRELLPGALTIRRDDGSTVPCRAEGALFSPRTEAAPAQVLLRLLPKEMTTSRFLVLNERIDALNREIAERRRAEAALVRANEELRRANADLEQFAYSASHDLREPLRMVAIYSELLQRRYQGRLDARADEYLRLAIEGARRMEALVADLLAYMQAISSHDEPIVPTAAGIVLDQALSNLKGAIKASRATIKCSPLPNLLVRDVHLLQVFQNLISNALKYRGEAASVIRITAQSEGQMWRISIHDNGIGIAPEYAEQVFGLFKRLHTSDQYSGTGIGLAICQKIVHRYGGRIWVESEGPGTGSNFCFTLPGGESISSGDSAQAPGAAGRG
jgi:PAS domain S-box-containing protein